MGLKNVRVELNDDGIRDLLNSSGVQSFLRGEGNQVASSAPGEYEVEVIPGKVRSRVRVRTKDATAKKASSESGALARAGFASGGAPGRG